MPTSHLSPRASSTHELGLKRPHPAGVGAGAPLSRVSGPEEALATVADALALAERELRALMHSDVAAVPAVAGYLAAAGGKRLRPALTALASHALQVPVNPRLMCVGELIHLGSLLHDDVVDEALTRRGQPAAHRIYGSPVTVLTGDFCLARAVLLAAEEGGHAVVTELARAVTEMAEGEVLQLQRSYDLSTDVDGYMEVVDRKSAALIAWCTAAPALAAGRMAEAQALGRFGRLVGQAFQITDDVLDMSEATGKTLGADLREGKITLPLVLAMEASPELKAELMAGLPEEARVPALVALVRETGALDEALAVAGRLVAEALEALEALPQGPGVDALGVLGRYLVERHQ